MDVNADIEDVFLAHESHESVQYIRQYMIDRMVAIVLLLFLMLHVQ